MTARRRRLMGEMDVHADICRDVDALEHLTRRRLLRGRRPDDPRRAAPCRVTTDTPPSPNANARRGTRRSWR